jgi:hypothetical protein
MIGPVKRSCKRRQHDNGNDWTAALHRIFSCGLLLRADGKARFTFAATTP